MVGFLNNIKEESINLHRTYEGVMGIAYHSGREFDYFGM